VISATVDISESGVAVISRLSSLVQSPARLHQASGAAVTKELKAHFLQRNQEPNKMGWPSQNFFSKEGFRRTALVHADESSALVAVASPAMAHRLRGGTVRPKRAKFLAIPLTAQAYAAGSPREMQDLSYLPPRPGRAALLVQQKKAARGEKRGEIIPQFALVKSATHTADPRTLPERDTLVNAASTAVEGTLQRMVSK
jgi:hypothetical protein